MASSARIDELRKKFDENPRRYFAPLANEYRKAGDLEQAIFICQEYLPQQPGHMSGHIVYGQALFELSRFDEARAVFETALSLDPENLIALRHLGDIARQAGDLRGARSWYQRVLEADPRNEEIAQIMLTVLTTPPESQPAVPTGEVSDGAEAVPEDAAGYEATAVQESPAGELPVEKSFDGSAAMAGSEVSGFPQHQAAQEIESPEAIPEDELLDLDDFNIGETPLSSLAVPPVAPHADAVAAAAPVMPEIDIERSGEVAVFADSDRTRGGEEPPPLPPESFATDIALGLPDDGTEPSLSDSHDPPPLAGLESYSEPSFATSGAPEVAPGMEFESFYATPDESPAEAHEAEPTAQVEPAETAWAVNVDAPDVIQEERVLESASAPVSQFDAPSGAEAGDTPAEAEPEAFVTETMAELYLQQGHREAALDIYQRLAEQRPGDEHLRARILAVSDAIQGASSASAAVAQPEPYEPYAAYGSAESAPDGDMADAAGLDGTADDAALVGPTIREFLSGVLQPRSFAPAAEVVETAPTHVYTTALDDTPFGETAVAKTEVAESPFEDMGFAEISFDDTAVDAPELAQPANVDETSTPAFDDKSVFDAPTVYDTGTFDSADALRTVAALDSLEAEPTPEPTPEPTITDGAASGPTFEESPFEATTAEMDLSEFRSQLPPLAESMNSTESIDEEFGFDANDWQPTGAAVEPEAAQPPAEPETRMPPETEREAPTREEVKAESAPIEAPPPAVSRPTPSSSETITGSIDALFSGADASTGDSSAASTLAQAFSAEVPETPHLQGKPARRATDELSLDHVFKSNPAPKPEAEGDEFSFDQFFADDMSDAAPKSRTEPASSAAQGADDIAQFNNWLNGLKKS